MLFLLALKIPRGDLAIETVDGNVTTPLIDGAEYARQRAEVTFDFWLGEWFLNVREGMPYRRDVLIKDPNPDVVRSVIRRGWLTVPGVVAVQSVEYEPDFTARRATINTQAIYKDGTPLPVSQEIVIG